MDTNDILDYNLGSDIGIQIESISKRNFIILFILTLGLYGVWWMYKAWRFFKEYKGIDVLPAARAIFAIFFMHTLFDKILRYAQQYDYHKSYSGVSLLILYIITNLFSRLPGLYFLLSLLGVFCFLQPLDAFNYYLKKEESYEVSILNGFNRRQLGLMVFCIVWWLLIIIGLMTPTEN